MLVQVSLLLTVAMAVVVEGDRYGGPRHDLNDCANSPSIHQRQASDLQCPERAVCADEWKTVRDWYNGTACKEKRIILHCQCPGNRQCPIGDEPHVFYANSKHRQYTCEPRCSTEKCSTRFRAAMEMVQGSPEFNGHNFYKINCRCRGHHFPMVASRRKLARATSYMRVRFNRTHQFVSTQYRCSYNLPMLGEEDPCSVDFRLD